MNTATQTLKSARPREGAKTPRVTMGIIYNVEIRAPP